MAGHTFRAERGATAVEYAVLLALVAAVIILAVTSLGLGVAGAFGDLGDAFAYVYGANPAGSGGGCDGLRNAQSVGGNGYDNASSRACDR